LQVKLKKELNLEKGTTSDVTHEAFGDSNIFECKCGKIKFKV